MLQVPRVGPGETSTTTAPSSHLVQESLAELLHGSLQLVSLGLPLLVVPDILSRWALPRGGPGVVVHVVIPASRIHALLPPGNTRGRCHCLSSDSSAGPAGRCLQLPCGNSVLMLVCGQQKGTPQRSAGTAEGTRYGPAPKKLPLPSPNGCLWGLDMQQQLENIQLLPQNVPKARPRGAQGCEPLPQLPRSRRAPHAAAQQRICG